MQQFQSRWNEKQNKSFLDDTLWTVGAEAWYPNELKNTHKNQHWCDYFN